MSDPALVFVDIETSGLDPQTEALLEVGIAVTDVDLNIMDSGSWVLGLAMARASDLWDPHVQKMHLSNGLINECASSTLTLAAAERGILSFLYHVGKSAKFPMCGSSVHFDRAWLKLHMPVVEEWFHYRNLDISSIKTAVNLWTPQKARRSNGDAVHRALPDLVETIGEFSYYRELLFRQHEPMSSLRKREDLYRWGDGTGKMRGSLIPSWPRGSTLKDPDLF